MEKPAAHPISRKDLEKHLAKVNEHMDSIKRSPTDRPSLFTLIQDIGGDKHIMDKDCQDFISILRDGFCLYFEMYSTLEDRIDKSSINGSLTDPEKKEFLGSYSLFAASSFIENQLRLKTDKEPIELERKEGYFKFDYTKDDTLALTLTRLYGMLNLSKRNLDLKSSQLPESSIEFFRFLKDEAVSKKQDLSKQLVDLVINEEFRVVDEFTITGFEASFEDEMSKLEKVDFVKVTPGEVVGNVQAKRKVIRYMDRLALYDPVAKNNPCMILGGLSWTNLWDGIPGTGKTTMMRIAMTRLAELADILGIQYKIHSIDQSVKSEFYGKTGQNALAEFNSTKDPRFLHITILDDLDLLTQGSRHEASGGADNDLRNVIMQFLDGAFTLRIGNNQVYAASNDPKGLDVAVRNRFSDRLLIEGPVTAEDFSDMTMIFTKKLREINKFQIEVGYKPFETQDNYIDGKWTLPHDVVYSVDKEFAQRFNNATVRDFGQYLYDLKKENPTISGRSVKAIIDAVKERSADFDVPKEFYEDRTVYVNQPFDRKVEILKELYTPISPEILFQEAKRYADSESRYSQGERDREVERGYNSRIWNMQAEVKALNDHPELFVMQSMIKDRILHDKKLIEDIRERVYAENVRSTNA